MMILAMVVMMAAVMVMVAIITWMALEIFNQPQRIA